MIHCMKTTKHTKSNHDLNIHYHQRKNHNGIIPCKHVSLRFCVISLCLLFMVTHLTGCTIYKSTSEPYTKQFIAFDTVATITIYDDIDNTTANQILNECNTICNTYESMLSRTKEESDVFKINHSQGAPTNVNPETIELIKASFEYSQKTDGLVDISIASLKELWDFSTPTDDATNDMIPSHQDIEKALTTIDYQGIIIDETSKTVTLNNPKSGIDLGFIAKGYIADQLAQYLSQQQIQHALINLGGNVYALGQKPDNTDFKVGIQKPFDANSYIDTIEVHDQSVVTSGVYERYFKVDDVLYHHVLDPHTGYPAKTDLYSVTIVCDSSMQADALSTTCLLLGSTKAKNLLTQYPDVTAYFIYDDNQIEIIAPTK